MSCIYSFASTSRFTLASTMIVSTSWTSLFTAGYSISAQMGFTSRRTDLWQKVYQPCYRSVVVRRRRIMGQASLVLFRSSWSLIFCWICSFQQVFKDFLECCMPTRSYFLCLCSCFRCLVTYRVVLDILTGLYSSTFCLMIRFISLGLDFNSQTLLMITLTRKNTAPLIFCSIWDL